jgi:hypothetical protein
LHTCSHRGPHLLKRRIKPSARAKSRCERSAKNSMFGQEDVYLCRRALSQNLECRAELGRCFVWLRRFQCVEVKIRAAIALIDGEHAASLCKKVGRDSSACRLVGRSLPHGCEYCQRGTACQSKNQVPQITDAAPVCERSIPFDSGFGRADVTKGPTAEGN